MNYVCLLAAAVIWGGNAIVAKASAGVIPPASMAFYRWVVAIAVLSPCVVPGLYANRKVIQEHLGHLAALGILGFAAFPGLMYLAAQFTSAIHIGIIQSLMPLLVIGISIGMLKHRPPLAAVIGAAFSLMGVALVVSGGHPASLMSQVPNYGDLLMMAATVCYALYIILLRHWQTGIPLTQSVYVQAWAAALMLLPFDLLSGGHAPNAASLPLIGYAGVLASVAAPVLWMYGISRVGPARASLFFNLVPVITAGLATALLSEPLYASSIVGGIMTIGGVMIAELWRRRDPPEQAPETAGPGIRT